MTHFRLLPSLASAFVLGAALIASGGLAHAGDGSTTMFKLQEGYGGPGGKVDGELEKALKDAGPGSEQATVTWVKKGEDVFVTTVWMSSDVEEKYRPWQLKCSTVKLSPNAKPELVVDQLLMTKLGDPNNNDEQPACHPFIARYDDDHIIYSYGSNDSPQNQTQTYVGIIDHMCNEVTAPIRVSNNANNNQGAPELAVHGDGWITAGYYDNNDQRTYARGLKMEMKDGKPVLTKMWNKTIVAPSNIGRPAIVPLSPTRAFLCAAKGTQRPPEMGVECALIDSMTGDILFKSYIAESKPSNDPKIAKYYNQPSVALLANNKVAIQLVESNGAGKNGNDKGSSLSHLFVVDVSDDGMEIKASKQNVGPYQTHPGMCAAGFGATKAGDTGERYVAVFQAPITGAGQPSLQYVSYDPVGKSIGIDTKAHNFVAGWYGDAGYLANIYGHNPNTQGRDFLRCVGDVPNPGYGVEGGYKANVKTFTAAPHAGRETGEPKNAMWLGLVPGVSLDPVQPGPPEWAGNPDSTGSGESSSTSAGAGGSDSSTSGAGAADSGNGINSDSGCAYASGSKDDTTFPFFALALAGLFLGRRRRKEVV